MKNDGGGKGPDTRREKRCTFTGQVSHGVSALHLSVSLPAHTLTPLCGTCRNLSLAYAESKQDMGVFRAMKHSRKGWGGGLDRFRMS